MLVEKDLQNILDHLAGGDLINVPLDGSNIMIQFVDHDSKLSLSALVYQGENYIPNSVRRCLAHKPPLFHPLIATSLSVDEDRFQVNLNYYGCAESLSHHHFKEILEEFGEIAEKWRIYLDDHDKNDLVYVQVK